MKPTPFDYRQDITLLRVTIDGTTNAIHDQRLQVWYRASRKGSSLTFDAFGEGDRDLEKFVPTRLQETDIDKVTCTMKESRVSAYVFCQTRDLDSLTGKIKESITEAAEAGRAKITNIETHLASWK